MRVCVSACCLFESFPNFSVEVLVLGPFSFKSFMSGDVSPLSAVSVVNVFSRSVFCLLTLSRVLFGVKTRSGLSVLSSVASVSRVAPESLCPAPRCEDRSPCLLLEDGGSAVCVPPASTWSSACAL